jgi:hypothetical protein
VKKRFKDPKLEDFENRLYLATTIEFTFWQKVSLAIYFFVILMGIWWFFLR